MVFTGEIQSIQSENGASATTDSMCSTMGMNLDHEDEILNILYITTKIKLAFFNKKTTFRLECLKANDLLT
jgi:hypothetical protein